MSNHTDDQRKLYEKRVHDAVMALSEHFDTVQIFVTRHEAGTDDGGTSHTNLGAGNWFARIGQVYDWLVTQEELTRSGITRRTTCE